MNSSLTLRPSGRGWASRPDTPIGETKPIFVVALGQPVKAVAVRRAELADEKTTMTAANNLAIRRALEIAGVEFIDENGGGPGVRLSRHRRAKTRTS